MSIESYYIRTDGGDYVNPKTDEFLTEKEYKSMASDEEQLSNIETDFDEAQKMQLGKRAVDSAGVLENQVDIESYLEGIKLAKEKEYKAEKRKTLTRLEDKFDTSGHYKHRSFDDFLVSEGYKPDSFKDIS